MILFMVAMLVLLVAVGCGGSRSDVHGGTISGSSSGGGSSGCCDNHGSGGGNCRVGGESRGGGNLDCGIGSGDTSVDISGVDSDEGASRGGCGGDGSDGGGGGSVGVDGFVVGGGGGYIRDDVGGNFCCGVDVDSGGAGGISSSGGGGSCGSTRCIYVW
jgi:hypothetical protein